MGMTMSEIRAEAEKIISADRMTVDIERLKELKEEWKKLQIQPKCLKVLVFIDGLGVMYKNSLDYPAEYFGQCKIEGTLYKITGFIQESKKKNKYIRLTFQPLEYVNNY